MFDLAQKFGSPLYIFDSQKAKNRINAIKGRLPKNARLCYAINANAFLVDSLKYEALLFEVCSPGDLPICEEKKLPPEKIVFSGVMKTQEDVGRAYKLNVNTITLESLTHCKYLINAIEQESEHSQDVIIRLTGNNQFGMSEKDVKKCIELLKPYANIHIRGIHFFTGTQKKLKKIAEEISFIEDFCTKLQQETGITFKSIEYGPGLSYEYFSNQNQSENFFELEEFSKLIANSNYDYVIELGRYVASPCGKYITKIMDIKGDEKSRYIIIDGGINHINYYGQMMGMKTPKVQHIKSGLNAENAGEENSATADYTIAGSLCTTADIVLRKLTLTSPRIGDLLVFSDIGAYSVTEGIYLFLSHPLPAVVMFDGKKYSILRKPQETYIMNA